MASSGGFATSSGNFLGTANSNGTPKSGGPAADVALSLEFDALAKWVNALLRAGDVYEEVDINAIKEDATKILTESMSSPSPAPVARNKLSNVRNRQLAGANDRDKAAAIKSKNTEGGGEATDQEGQRQLKTFLNKFREDARLRGTALLAETGLREKIERSIAAGQLTVKDTVSIYSDIGLQCNLLELILSLHPVWLHLGLEVVFDKRIELETARAVPVHKTLARFVSSHLFIHPDIIKNRKFTGGSANLVHEAGRRALHTHFLTNVALLLVAVDRAFHDPTIYPAVARMFTRYSKIKSQDELLNEMTSLVLSGKSLTLKKVLARFGFVSTYKQSPLDDYIFEVNSFGNLNDGVILGKLAELLYGLARGSMLQKMRPPAGDLIRKKRNVDVVLTLLRDKGVDIGNMKATDITLCNKAKVNELLRALIGIQREREHRAARIIQRAWRLYIRTKQCGAHRLIDPIPIYSAYARRMRCALRSMVYNVEPSANEVVIAKHQTINRETEVLEGKLTYLETYGTSDAGSWESDKENMDLNEQDRHAQHEQGQCKKSGRETGVDSENEQLKEENSKLELNEASGDEVADVKENKEGSVEERAESIGNGEYDNDNDVLRIETGREQKTDEARYANLVTDNVNIPIREPTDDSFSHAQDPLTVNNSTTIQTIIGVLPPDSTVSMAHSFSTARSIFPTISPIALQLQAKSPSNMQQQIVDVTQPNEDLPNLDPAEVSLILKMTNLHVLDRNDEVTERHTAESLTGNGHLDLGGEAEQRQDKDEAKSPQVATDQAVAESTTATMQHEASLLFTPTPPTQFAEFSLGAASFLTPKAERTPYSITHGMGKQTLAQLEISTARLSLNTSGDGAIDTSELQEIYIQMKINEQRQAALAKQIEVLAQYKREEEAKRRAESALKIQCWWRGMRVRRVFAEQIARIAMNTAEYNRRKAEQEPEGTLENVCGGETQRRDDGQQTEADDMPKHVDGGVEQIATEESSVNGTHLAVPLMKKHSAQAKLNEAFSALGLYARHLYAYKVALYRIDRLLTLYPPFVSQFVFAVGGLQHLIEQLLNANQSAPTIELVVKQHDLLGIILKSRLPAIQEEVRAELPGLVDYLQHGLYAYAYDQPALFADSARLLVACHKLDPSNEAFERTAFYVKKGRERIEQFTRKMERLCRKNSVAEAQQAIAALAQLEVELVQNPATTTQ